VVAPAARSPELAIILAVIASFFSSASHIFSLLDYLPTWHVSRTCQHFQNYPSSVNVAFSCSSLVRLEEMSLKAIPLSFG
jgi:hypothetical protein